MVATKADFRQYMIVLGSRGLAQSTIARRINGIKSYYHWLCDEEILDKDPTRSVHPPRREKPEPTYLLDAEVHRVLRSAYHNPLHFTLLTLISFSGLRRSEVLNLKWEDIDFGVGTITVRLGKGKKGRVVPLAEQLDPVLWEFLQKSLPLRGLWVFSGPRGGRLSKNTLSEIVRHYVRAAGLNKPATAHSFRHSVATRLSLAGVELATIQDILGHNEPTTTARYTHSTLRRKAQAIEQLPRLALGNRGDLDSNLRRKSGALTQPDGNFSPDNPRLSPTKHCPSNLLVNIGDITYKACCTCTGNDCIYHREPGYSSEHEHPRNPEGPHHDY